MRSLIRRALSSLCFATAFAGTPCFAQADFLTPRVLTPESLPPHAIGRLGSRAFAHAGSIGAVAFAPDGSRILSGGFDRTLRLWDANTGEELMRIVDLFGYAIGTIVYCPDTRYVIIGDGASAFGRFDLQEMKPVFRAMAAVDQFAVDATATRLAAFGPALNAIHVHDLATDGRLLETIPIERGVARSAAWSPDGKWLAYGRQTKKGHMKYDGAIVLTTLGEKPEVIELPVPDVLFTSMEFSPDGSKLLCGATNGALFVVDVAQKAIVETKKIHEAVIIAIRYAPDGKTVATGSNDTHLSLVDAATFEVVHSVAAHATGVRSIAFSPDGKRIVTGSFDSNLGIWDSETLESRFESPGHQRPVSSAIQVDADTVVTSSYGGDVIVWSKGAQESRTKVMGGFVFQLTYAPATHMLAAAGQDAFVALWSDGGRGPMRRIDSGDAVSLAAAFSHDGTRLAVSFADGSVRVYQVEDGSESFRVTHDSKFVTGVAWGPGDTELWTAASTLFCWDASNGKPLRSIQEPRAPIQSLEISPDGRLIAVGAADSKAHVYDRERGAEVLALPAAQGRVKDVAFSPDGKWLATSSESELGVSVWNLADGTRARSLEGHEGPVLGLDFSADGSRLFTSSIDGVTLVWDFPALMASH
jgi:WD40 repeat protein